MIITKIELTQFRSYDKLSLTFDKGVNVFVGRNGAGKTNIVEAIQYLSLVRSFRTNEDSELIKLNQEFATIAARIEGNGSPKQIRILIGKNGKRIIVDQQPIKQLSQLSELVNVIVFEPRDVLLFSDVPRTRRRFLDVSLSKHSKNYLQHISRYEKILEERNNILKNEHIDKIHLEIITKTLVENAKKIDTYRIEYIGKINKILSRLVKTIKGETTQAEVIYQPFVLINNEYEVNALEAFNRSLESDIRRKTTQVGPHREDFYVTLNGRNVAQYGSQGENRLTALALKLTPYFLIEDENKKPIVVLDDVLSELDQKHQDNLIELLNRLSQVFITTTQYKYSATTLYEVTDQTVIRRNFL